MNHNNHGLNLVPQFGALGGGSASSGQYLGANEAAVYGQTGASLSTAPGKQEQGTGRGGAIHGSQMH